MTRDRLRYDSDMSRFGGSFVAFLFFDSRADDKFTKFFPTGMEGDSRWGETFFASQVWWGGGVYVGDY